MILAGITLTFVLGDNSVFSKASQAKIQTELAKIEERAQMIYSSKMMETASGTLNTKVETSQVISQLIEEGYTIEDRPVSAGDITGISLDKTNITMGKNSTLEITVTYEGAEDPFIYYTEVQGKYYQMHSNKGFITIDRGDSNLTKADFENGGSGAGISTANLAITSSDESVATAALKAESNKIIEIASKEVEKEVTITVTYGSYAKECKVEVIEPVLATRLTLNETEYVVTGGESWTNDLQLIATLEPNNVTEKEVNWKSSNSEIATVDSNGLVKAGTKGGDVKITATTKDGTNLLAECKIITELFGSTNASSISYTDSDGNVAKIPDGYAVGTSENVNKVTGGLVAQDNEGNQFVWIPVGDVKQKDIIAFTVTLGRYAFVKDQQIPSTPVQTEANYAETISINGYQESINQAGENSHAKALKKFIDNAILDGGYWFARFEASNNSGAKSKYDKASFVWVKQSEASSYAQGMKNTGTYQSDLVNSYAWDTAIVFIEKSGNAGYASQTSKNTSTLNTGKSGDKVSNIYDMASNCFEWNTECTEPTYHFAAYRGFEYGGSIGFTSARGYAATSQSFGNATFRVVLYRP